MRERIEDLGVIKVLAYVLLNHIDNSWASHFLSKHATEEFVEYYSNSLHLEDLHSELRHQRHKLEEICTIAAGYTDDE